MDDFVKRKDAIEAFDDPAVERYYGDVDPDSVIRVIEAIPPEDVRPVVRGKWLPIIEANEYGETYQTGCYCSECNEVLQYEPNFCPNCGADMRGNNG